MWTRSGELQRWPRRGNPLCKNCSRPNIGWLLSPSRERNQERQAFAARELNQPYFFYPQRLISFTTMGSRESSRRSRAWLSIDDDPINFDPVQWKHLISIPTFSGFKDLIYGIGFSILMMLSASQLLPSAQASMAVIAVFTHCCIVGLMRGMSRKRPFSQAPKVRFAALRSDA